MAELTKRVLDLDTEAAKIVSDAEKAAAELVLEAQKSAQQIVSKAKKSAVEKREAEFEKLKKSLELYRRQRLKELEGKKSLVSKRLSETKAAEEIAGEITERFFREMKGG